MHNKNILNIFLCDIMEKWLVFVSFFKAAYTGCEWIKF